MPLNAKIGGQVRYIKDREAICLMKDQAKHICKMVETDNIVNVDAIKQEIQVDKLDKIDDINSETNPYYCDGVDIS